MQRSKIEECNDLLDAERSFHRWVGLFVGM